MAYQNKPQASSLEECVYHKEEPLGLLTFREMLEGEPVREAEVGRVGEEKRGGGKEAEFQEGRSVVQCFQEDRPRSIHLVWHLGKAWVTSAGSVSVGARLQWAEK